MEDLTREKIKHNISKYNMFMSAILIALTIIISTSIVIISSF